MADELTPNYGILLPKPSDTMSQKLTPSVPGLSQNLRDAFEAFEAAANPTIIASPPLPQTGDYAVGDRIFLSHASYRSSFILLSKDPAWGWVWRPVQAGLSPWRTIPSTAIIDSNYELHPTLTFGSALDNKGNCYWRGAIRKKTVGLPNHDSQNIFATLPAGLRHATSGMFTLAIDPATPQSDTGLEGYKGGRWYIQNDGYNSLRFHNPASGQDIHFTGIEYVASERHYYGA